jgi:hypothetical protein
MPVSGISSSTVAAKYAPPSNQQKVLAKTTQKSQATDTVSISQQASKKALQAQQAQQFSSYGNAKVQGATSSNNGSAGAKLTGKA